MKSINANDFDSENIRVDKLKVSGFDIIITDVRGEQVKIVDGLPDVLTGVLKLLNNDGTIIDETEIVNSIDASKLGLEVAVFGSLIDGGDIEIPKKAEHEDNSHTEKMDSLLAENKQLKEQLIEAEKQSVNEKQLQLQVDIPPSQSSEIITAALSQGSVPLPNLNRAKKKLLDESGGGSSSTNDQSSSTKNTQEGEQDGAVGKNLPLIAELNAKSDSGVVGDNITNFTQPTFSGTTAPFVLVTLTIGTIVYTTRADANGDWTINVIHDLTEGGHSYKVSAEDNAGNSTFISGVIVIDTVAQTITVELDSQSDSGVKGNFITNDTKPILKGTAECGAAMTLLINGITYTFNADASGNWLFTLPNSLSEGMYEYTVTVTDVAGNSTSYNGALTIDTTPPALVVELDPGNVIYGDNIIGNSQPIFSGTAEPGVIITLFITDVTYSLIVDQSGAWRFSVPDILANGEWAYSITATDSAGNQTIINDKVIIQNKDAELQIEVTAGLDESTDSGTIGDNITNNTRPILVGTAVANALITLTLAGVTYTTTADSNGKWSFYFEKDYPDGIYDYNIVATAPDGTMGKYSDSFIIDTTPPDISVSLDTISDSGLIGNGITNVKLPVLTGLTEPYAIVMITIDGIEYKTTANGAGQWSVQITTELKEGQNDYMVNVTDRAGNNSSATGSITLDTEIVPLTGIKFSDGDGRYSSTYTPTIEGWGEAGAMLTISIGSRSYTITVPESRKWFFYVPNGFIQSSNSVQYITFKQTDAAGNSTSTTIKFHFITEKPEISADISEDSDTGIIGDKITSNTSPTLTGKVISTVLTPSQLALSKVSLIIDGITYSGIAVNSDGSWSFKLPVDLLPGYSYNYTVSVTDFVGNTNSYNSVVTITNLSGNLDAISITGENSTMETADTSPTLSGSATAASTLTIYINNQSYNVPVTGKGLWTFKVPEVLGNGKFTFTLVEKTVDGVTNTYTGYFVVDTKAPDVLTVEILDPESGSSNIINQPNATLYGRTEALALVTILIGGITYKTYADASGNWLYSFDSDAFSINTPINYKVTASDAAGNKTSIDGSFIIDTISISAGLDINSNSGDPHDNITNVRTPTFSGATAANAEIILVINGEKYTTTADSTGKWSITLDKDLPDNTYNYTITATSGEKVNYTKGEVVIDTFAIPPNLNLADGSDSGVVGDYITNVKNPILAGVTEPNASISLSLNGVTYYITASSDGTWSFTVPNPLLEGNNSYSIFIIDNAGNTSSKVTGNIILDTIDPSTSAVLSPSDNSGDLDDNITNVTTPTVTGLTEAGSTIVLKINNYTYSTRADNNGVWSLKINDALPDGNNAYTIIVTDVAGNQGTESGHIVIDTIAPEVMDITVANSDYSDITDISMPIFRGQVSETDAKITITFAGDETKYDVTIKPDGSWEYQHNAPFNPGSNEYTIEVSDIAGNTSSTSGSFEVVSTATTRSLPEDSSYNSSPVELSGVVEAQAQVEISIGEEVYHTQADQIGNWSIVTAPYPAGDYEYSIKVTTTASEVSIDKNTITLEPDINVSPVAADHGDSGVSNSLGNTFDMVESTFDISSHDEHM
ncbi:TPA: Ig-like domain-containing protein [Salmonella enterica subsp. diarizonae serovar 61:l,v:z35]